MQASVLAGTGMWAEALTKAVLLGGSGVVDRLDAQGIGVFAVHGNGSTTANATWRRLSPRSSATQAVPDSLAAAGASIAPDHQTIPS